MKPKAKTNKLGRAKWVARYGLRKNGSHRKEEKKKKKTKKKADEKKKAGSHNLGSTLWFAQCGSHSMACAKRIALEKALVEEKQEKEKKRTNKKKTEKKPQG